MYLVDINQTIDSVVNLYHRVGGVGFLDSYYVYYPMYDTKFVLVSEVRLIYRFED